MNVRGLKSQKSRKRDFGGQLFREREYMYEVYRDIRRDWVFGIERERGLGI